MNESQGYFYDYEICPFLKEYKSKAIVSLSSVYNGTFSSASNISMRKSMLGMIGEGFERAAMSQFLNIPLKKDREYYCVDMLEKKIIEMEEINCSFLDIYFYDSCGMASYTNSDNCVENALSEFIERQAFMLSYLSKKTPRVVEKDEKFFSIIPERYHFLNFYDISILDSYKVYFAIGSREGTVYCALGAGYTSYEAIQKVVKELSIGSVKHGTIKAKPGEQKDYIHFFHMLSIEQILNAYDYLNRGENIKYIETKKHTIDTVIDELYVRYKMKLFLTGLFHPHYSHSILKNSKNVKIFAPNWFPSFKISSIPKEVFDNIESVTGLNLTRNTNYIPFP